MGRVRSVVASLVFEFGNSAVNPDMQPMIPKTLLLHTDFVCVAITFVLPVLTSLSFSLPIMETAAPTGEQQQDQQQQQPAGSDVCEARTTPSRTFQMSRAILPPKSRMEEALEADGPPLAHRDFFNDFPDDFNLKDLE